MFKNKLSASVLAGVMALVGMVGGTAFIASAQVAKNSTAPIVTNNQAVSQNVDTPESTNDQTDNQGTVDSVDAGGKADTDNIQDGVSVSQGASDTDGGAASEAAEPAGSSDTSEQ